MHSGLLLIDKEAGWTSHDVVQKTRRALGQRKVGHCGTLDPAATGLLVLTLGRATRLTRFLINAPKTYSGTIRFGVTTDTYDATGEVTRERPIDELSETSVRAAIADMVGSMDQAAPAYSAKKVDGVKYYQLARRGEAVPNASKEITIFDFDVEGELADGRLDFTLSCSTGTYVRSVANDLGEALGCGAHLEALRRLSVGPFEIADARTLSTFPEEAISEPSELGAAWIPFDEIPLPFRRVPTDGGQERRIGHGQTVLIREVDCEEGDWVQLVGSRNQLIAVGSVVETIGERGVAVVRPRIVFR